MGYILRDGLTFCTAGDRTVFLDLREDRYICLPLAAEAAFQQLVRDPAGTLADRDALKFLVGQGFLIEGARSGTLADHLAKAPVARGSLVHDARGSGFGARLLALSYLLTTRWRLRRRGAAAMLRRAKAAKASLASSIDPVPSDVLEIAAAFDAMGLFLTAHEQCLPRSLALSACLSADRYAHEVIVAVKMRPFDAHCWVQIGGTVINDTVDRIRMFTPILVL